MGECKEQVDDVIMQLKIPPEDIRLLDFNTNKKVYFDCLDHFVKSGDRKWWWEDFRQKYFILKDLENYDVLKEILPDTEEKVWFMIEDDEDPFYPIYEVKAAFIPIILSEYYYFEYYIINKNKDWLLCENHHDRVYGIGEILRNKNISRILE